MKENLSFTCNNLEEIKTATSQLDRANLVPLKIDDGGVVKDVENFKGIYNVTQGKFCTAVIPYYNLIQHKQYFDNFADSLNKLGINFSMVIQQQGNRAFADIEFKDRNLKFEKLNEEFTTGIRLINSYNKSTGICVMPKFTRLACTNGMVITRMEKTLSVKHHSKLVCDIQVFIEKRINHIISRNEDLKIWVSESIKDSIEWRNTCGILAKLFKQIKHREEILKRLGIDIIAIKDKKTKKKNVSYVWTDKTKKKDKFTRWEIYNAITHYLTHGEQITPHIENLFQKRAEILLTTKLEKMPKIEVTI